MTGSRDGSVRIGQVPDSRAGTAQRVGIDKSTTLTGHGIAVECVTFSADGKRIAFGRWDNTVQFYDETGKEIAVLKGHDRGIMAMAFSPDSKTLATVSGDHAAPVAGEIRLWDAADGKDRGLIGKQGDMARGVAFTKDSSRVVTTGRDHTLRIWDLASRSQLQAFQDPGTTEDEPKIIEALAYSPDGSILAVAGEGGSIALWNVKDRQRFATLDCHTAMVHVLAWNGDGTRLVSASADRTVIVWYVAVRKELLKLNHPGAVYAAALSLNGKTIATGGFDTAVHLWNADTSERIAKREGQPRAFVRWRSSAKAITWRVRGPTMRCGSGRYRTIVSSCVDIRDPSAPLSRSLMPCWQVLAMMALYTSGTCRAAKYVTRLVRTRRERLRSRPYPTVHSKRPDWRLATSKCLIPQRGKLERYSIADTNRLRHLPFRPIDANPPRAATIGRFVFGQPVRSLSRPRFRSHILDRYERRLFRPIRRLLLREAKIGSYGRQVGRNHGSGEWHCQLYETGMWRESHEVIGHPGKVVFSIDFAADGQTALTAGGDSAVVIWKISGGDFKVPEFVPPVPSPRNRVVPMPFER